MTRYVNEHVKSIDIDIIDLYMREIFDFSSRISLGQEESFTTITIYSLSCHRSQHNLSYI